MYSIIVLSHGDLANGLKDTMMMILGEQESTYFISFTPSDSVEDFEKKVNVIFNSISKDRQVLFLTDLYGGTPNHVATAQRLKQPERVEVLSGVNLPLLMTAVLSKDQCLSDIVEKLLEECHQGIIRVDVKTEGHEDDE
ncbi:MAG: PTS sugar transporter subunit IIA [Erysipelotrichaceae bacterium]